MRIAFGCLALLLSAVPVAAEEISAADLPGRIIASAPQSTINPFF
jgi:hypothetical protein